MLPIIEPEFILDPLYQTFVSTLKKTSFSGEICADYASRLAVATDNSIYQVIPQAVIFPKNTADIAIALALGHEEKFKKIKFSPRGGGVGANGQSLSSSIIIDCSKYMRQILELNIQEHWVRVQPGVVQDQLNDYLAPYHLYFAPEISPSNRATLGGMINTDACGNGQKIIGRTSDHIIELTGILSDGTIFSSLHSSSPQFDEISNLLKAAQTTIQARFPKTPRTLAGYNLLKAYTNKLHLNYLLSGSEGTLAVVSECKLKLMPIPKYKKLVVLQYRSFQDALQALDITPDIKPLVIECIDSQLLDLARQDPIYFHVKDFIENNTVEQTRAINLVEFIADEKAELDKQIQTLCHNITTYYPQKKHAIGFYVAEDTDEIKKIWELRKKSVGLISKKKLGTRRPIPFIEDTAVAPEQLVGYIQEFKTLLDQYQLSYGMYGHVDAGCVHVRPALDLQLPEDQALHEKLSTQVVALLQKYNGVMWGEHGMGFRTQFNPEFFGAELYEIIRKIKTIFDPYNKLNPGKIAIPYQCDEELVRLSGPLRAQFDKQIPLSWQEEYAAAITCNGNGACFNYATQDVMCPSYKVTKNRVHSPKGRAALLREWLRQLKRFNMQSIDAFPKNFFSKVYGFFKKCLFTQCKQDFTHEVFKALNGCLNCKACAGQCPLNVDIPHLKSKFLALYYQRYFRPLRDYLIASMEYILILQSCIPGFSNYLLQLKCSQWILKNWIKLVDIPKITCFPLKKELKKRNASWVKSQSFTHLTEEEKRKSVILLQDIFTRYYRPELVLKTYDIFTTLGYKVYLAPIFINGKPFHVKGFINTFKKIATKNIHYLNQLAKLNIPIVGIDPSITLTYRDEYRNVAQLPVCEFNVFLPQEWLQDYISKNPVLSNTSIPEPCHLLSHCTEKAMCVAAEKQWITVFAAFGIQVKPIAVGCCGMSGAYGHEAEHVQFSKELFAMDWEQYFQKKSVNHICMVTGYSCYSQVLRLQNVFVAHPLEVLFDTLPVIK